MKVRVAAAMPPGNWTVIRLLAKEQRAKLVPHPSDAEFSGAVGSLLHDRVDSFLSVGLGKAVEVDAQAVRVATGTAGLRARKLGIRRVVLVLDEWSNHADAAVEGLVLGNYRNEQFLPKKTDPIAELVVLVQDKDYLGQARTLARRGDILGTSTNMARQVGNMPGNLLYPETLAAESRKLAKKAGLKCSVLGEKSLHASGFRGVLAVGQGSARPPKVIVLEHNGGRKGEPPLVLVGKAITFDTGGISIKPAANMEEMIFDKCGGIAVLGAMHAIATLGLSSNVVGILAAAENMPSGTAYRPGDIITMRSGVTVEIVNTDAEGRMVLGDAIHFGVEDYRASKIVNVATLTGACGVALGESAAGLWSNNEAFNDEVLQSAQKAGERLWPMPSFPEYAEKIRSDVAQIKNSGGRLGGACTAAAFLQVFAGRTPWAHLDVAYTAHQGKDAHGLAQGATGFGVRTLVNLAESQG